MIYTLAQLGEMTPMEYPEIELPAFYQEQVNELYNDENLADEGFFEHYHKILEQYINGYQIGEKVHWNDPCLNEYGDIVDIAEAKARVFEVIDIINEDVYRISDSYTDVEVYSAELERVS